MPEMSDNYKKKIFQRILAYAIPLASVASFGSTLSMLSLAIER